MGPARSIRWTVRLLPAVIPVVVGATPPCYDAVAPSGPRLNNSPLAISPGGIGAGTAYSALTRKNELAIVQHRHSTAYAAPDGTLGVASSTVAVNDAGNAAASVRMPDDSTGLALWTAGTPTLLPVPAACVFAEAWSINSEGVVAGGYDFGTQYLPSLWRAGTFEPLALPPGADQAAALRERADGSVFMVALDPAGAGFIGVARAGAFERWATPAAMDFATAYAANDAGFAVGHVAALNVDPARSIPARWHDGVASVLGVPAAISGSVFAVNSSGDAVGSLYPTGGGASPRALLWTRDGATIDLNDHVTLPPGDSLSAAFGISDDGVIIAITSGPGGGGSAVYILTPQCPADFDHSGGTPDTTDISACFAAWLTGDPSADVDCSGGTPDSTDIAAFFDAWLAGGC